MYRKRRSEQSADFGVQSMVFYTLLNLDNSLVPSPNNKRIIML